MNIESINKIKKSLIFRLINLSLLVVSLKYLYDYYQNLDLFRLYSYDFFILIPIALLVFGNIINAFAWSSFIGDKDINFQQINIWMISSIGKYLPFKIGIPSLRTSLNLNVSKHKSKNILKKIFFEQIIIIIFTLFFGLLYFLKNQISLSVFYILFLILFLLIIFKNKYFPKIYIVIYGFGQWFIVFGLIQFSQLNYVNLNHEIIFGYLLTSTASMVALNIPAGIGFREALTLLFFEGIFSSELIYIFVINIRALLVVVDLIIFIIGILTKYIYQIVYN